MARISDLIRYSKLETYFLPVETIHRFQESDSTSGQRLVTRLKHWRRQEKIGKGGFGSVWLEKCTKGGRPGAIAQEGAVRAVKQIDIDRRFGPVDSNLPSPPKLSKESHEFPPRRRYRPKSLHHGIQTLLQKLGRISFMTYLAQLPR